MRKRYKIWCVNTVASLLVILTLHSSIAVAGPMEDGQAAGASSANQALSLFGTKSGSNANISVPMTNSTTQLSTINGSSSFSANLTSPSSSVFLELLMQPSGSGDLQQLIISQDLNADGTTDNVYTVPRVVSGVCSNGYYSCTPGTWSNCQPYKWVSDGTGKISDASAGPTDLGGCYCINSSCGSNLVWTNGANVLKDLGGGNVAAMQNANINFTITNVSTSPIQIFYYGNLTGNATVQPVQLTQNLPPPVTAQNYYTNYAGIASDLNSITMSQSGDPSSIYYNVIHAGSVNQNQGQDKQCTITRFLSLNSTTNSYSNTGSGSKCTDHFIFMKIWQVDNTTYKPQLIDTCPGGLDCPYNNCSNAGVDTNGWFTTATVTLPPPSATSNGKLITASYTLTGMTGGGCSGGGSGGVDGILQGFGYPVQAAIICPDPEGQTVNYNWSYLFQYALDQLVESVTDPCAILASDPTCTLKDETVDGVNVRTAFVATGLQPLPTCATLTGGAGPMQVCRPWMQQDRTYTCGTTTTWDFSDFKQRGNAVVSSVSLSGNNLSYSDTTKGSGGTWTPGSGTGTLITAPTVDPCELSCKTQTTPGSTQVTVSGNVSQLRTNPSASTDYAYKICVNGACPLDPGETVVTDCSCLSDFNAAFTAIQAIRMAGKDTICTSGALLPMH